jgi:hypothetical protein
MAKSLRLGEIPAEMCELFIIWQFIVHLVDHLEVGKGGEDTAD